MSGMTKTAAGSEAGLCTEAGSGDAASLLTRPKQPDLWYREPWLFLVVGGPALVVVACVITTYLALRHPDPLVSKDYYRDGLRINQTMAAEEAARKLVLMTSPASAKPAASVAGANEEGRQK